MADDNKQVASPDKHNVVNKFVGIPIAELEAAPLVEVCDSHKRLPQSAFEFMQEMGFNEAGKTRMVQVDFQMEVTATEASREK